MTRPGFPPFTRAFSLVAPLRPLVLRLPCGPLVPLAAPSSSPRPPGRTPPARDASVPRTRSPHDGRTRTARPGRGRASRVRDRARGPGHRAAPTRRGSDGASSGRRALYPTSWPSHKMMGHVTGVTEKPAEPGHEGTFSERLDLICAIARPGTGATHTPHIPSSARPGPPRTAQEPPTGAAPGAAGGNAKGRIGPGGVRCGPG